MGICLSVQRTQVQSCEQLNQRTTTSEARVPGACAPQEEPQQWEAWQQLERSPHSQQLEKARIQQWRPSTNKNKIKHYLIKENYSEVPPHTDQNGHHEKVYK